MCKYVPLSPFCFNVMPSVATCGHPVCLTSPHARFNCVFPYSNKTSDVLQEIRKGITEQGLKPHFPIEVRFVKNDKIFLSPTSGHSPRCFINIGMFR